MLETKDNSKWRDATRGRDARETFFFETRRRKMLTAILSTIEGLTEDEQKHYVQKDGKYVLDVKPVEGFELADVQGLRNTVKTLRAEKEDLNNSISIYKDIDPTRAREAMAKVKMIEDGEYEFDKDEAFTKALESERKKMAEKHVGEIEPLKNENNSLRGQLEKIFVDNVAMEAITKRDPNANTRLLLPHLKSRLKAEEFEPAKFRTVVMDVNGQKDIDGQGQPISIDSLVDEMVETFPEAFSGHGSSGIGDNGDSNKSGNGGVTIIPKSNQDAMNNNLEAIASGKARVDVDS